MSPDFLLPHGPQRKEVGGTGCCEEGCSFFPRRGGEWRRPLCLPLPVVLPQGGVTLGGEGLGGCRGQAPWMGTSTKMASLGAGGEGSWWERGGSL